MGKLRLSFCSVWEPQPLPHWAESAQTVEKYTTPNLRVRILRGQAGTPASLLLKLPSKQTTHWLGGAWLPSHAFGAPCKSFPLAASSFSSFNQSPGGQGAGDVLA